MTRQEKKFDPKEILAYIKTISPFDIVSESCQKAIAAAMKHEYFQGGDCLMRQGEEGDRLYIVWEGRLYFQVNSFENETINGEYSAGSIIGEFALLGNVPRTATIYALRDTLLLSLARSDFTKIFQKYPEILQKIAENSFKKLVTPAFKALKFKQKAKTIAIFPIKNIETCFNHNNIKEIFLSQENCLFLDSQNYAQKSQYSEIERSLISWLNQSERQYDYVFYWADSYLSAWSELCVRQADTIVLLTPAKCGDYALDEIEKLILSHTENLPKRKILILFHEKETHYPRNTDRWLDSRKVDLHLNVRFSVKKDMDRLMRIITDRAKALVLSGGAARGLAHIGLIRYLEENNMDIDFVAGCSMGAIVASWYAMGCGYTELVEITKTYVKNAIKMDYTFPYMSIIRGKNIYSEFSRTYGELKIEDSWLPFFCNSTDMISSKPHIHKSGYLWKAVRASLSLPVLFPPVSFEGMLLFDGGIINNIPVAEMKKFSHHAYTIASNIDIENKLTKYNIPDYVSGFLLVYKKILKKAKKEEALNIAEIILRLILLSSSVESERMLQLADERINLQMQKFEFMDFHKYQAIIDYGYELAKHYFTKAKK